MTRRPSAPLASQIADLFDGAEWTAARSGVVGGVAIEKGTRLYEVCGRFSTPTYPLPGVAQFLFFDRSGIQLAPTGWQLVHA